MATSFVSVDGKGFWCPDSLLEIFAYFLAEELAKNGSPWAQAYVQLLRTQATAGFTGCMDLGLSSLSAEAREAVAFAARDALCALQRSRDVEFQKIAALTLAVQQLLSPWVHLVLDTIAWEDMREFVRQRFAPNGVTALLDGRRVESLAQFYREIEEALPLISGFGRNLNALYDLFSTLGSEYASGRCHAFVWYRPDIMLERAPLDFRQVVVVILEASNALLYGDVSDPTFDPHDEQDWISTRLDLLFITSNVESLPALSDIIDRNGAQISRQHARTMVAEARLAQLTEQERMVALSEWWSLESPDPGWDMLPESLRHEMQQHPEGPVHDVISPKYNPLLLLSALTETVGVTNTWLATVLRDTLGAVQVDGEVESLEPCRCCGFRTIEHRGDYEVCPVCFWEDDGSSALDVLSGPNHMSLARARANFANVGSSCWAGLLHQHPDAPKMFVRDQDESSGRTAVFSNAVHRFFHSTGTSPVLIEANEQFELTAFGTAVVMLHAVWSGPSAACLKCLSSVAPPISGTWLYVVNIDTVAPDLIERALGRRSHGRGETFWVENGSVRNTDEGYAMRPNDVMQSNEALFGSNR